MRMNVYRFPKGATVTDLLDALMELRGKAWDDTHVVMPDGMCVKLVAVVRDPDRVILSDLMSDNDEAGTPEQLADRADGGENLVDLEVEGKDA
jgi:hypothetical protein